MVPELGEEEVQQPALQMIGLGPTTSPIAGTLFPWPSRQPWLHPPATVHAARWVTHSAHTSARRRCRSHSHAFWQVLKASASSQAAAKPASAKAASAAAPVRVKRGKQQGFKMTAKAKALLAKRMKLKK